MSGILEPLKPLYSESIVIDDEWESLVSEGMEAREQKDQSQWRLGELADKVNKRYGSDALGVFAVSIGVNKRSLQRYRDVFRGYRGKEINSALSFSHHLKALGGEEPEVWLKEAYENGWSVEKLGVEMGGEKGESYRQFKVCPHCHHPQTDQPLCTCK